MVIMAKALKMVVFQAWSPWGMSRYQANQLGGQETLESNNSSSCLDNGQMPVQQTLSAS